MDSKTLALYLGCRVTGTNSYVGWKLVGITSDHDGTQYPLIKDESRDYVMSLPNFDCVKLILRPLSSMTVKHGSVIYDLAYPDSDYRNTADSYKHYMVTTQIKDVTYTPSLVIALIHEGFDLFGLIEKGEAVSMG